jgi:hypothetical protein
VEPRPGLVNERLSDEQAHERILQLIREHPDRLPNEDAMPSWIVRYGPHQHEIEGQLLKVHPEDADKLRAAGMGVDLWGGE